ncbi:unnamed protein product [Pieris macdunnoughi]|uniref:DUF7869 domain-containing protein n=1 Tax=Pieris macdunnoughi TaxID=345717 RepID=A0A821UG36_9NEOP|nr:unnamed protein product [Pieris macdunnoughi]
MEAEYSLHLIRKTECQEAKAKDKLKASEDPTLVTATFDLQSVLQLPYSGVSLFYYSRKICVYNLTIYLASGEAHCYTWNELNGKRGSNEIGSILLIFLQSLPVTVTSVSLFCDTCGGQDRNQQVAAMLLYAVKKIEHLNQIELKFLESGHTQMECDPMHSAIESAKKHKSAFTMTDWINIFRSARSQRGKNKASVEKGSPDILFCRYDHSSEYKKVNIVGGGRRKSAAALGLKPAYSDPLPISKAKKADLVKLVNAGHIPEELHLWYRNIPAIDVNGPERLSEPDESEDEN